MALRFETTEGPLHISDFQIRAIVRHAEYKAKLTAAALEATGLFPTKPAKLPAAYLLELAATLELGMWERRGLRPYLPADLPSFSDAAHALLQRAQSGSHAFDDPNDVSLAPRVLKAWIDHFAWDGLDLLNAETVVGEVDEDQFADVLADFVWQHRRKFSALLNDLKTPDTSKIP